MAALAPYLPYIVAAGGTAVSLNAQQEAASERRQILNRQLDNSQKATEKASDLVQKEAENYAPDARQQALAKQEQQALAQSQADLAGAGGNIIDTAGGSGNVSADFIKSKADRQISEGNRLTEVAREAAKTRAPQLLGTVEGQRRAKLAGELQNTFGTTRNLAQAGALDADSVEAPAYGQIAGLVGQLGSSYLAGNTGGAGIFGGKNPGFSGTQKAAPIIDMSFRK